MTSLFVSSTITKSPSITEGPPVVIEDERDDGALPLENDASSGALAVMSLPNCNMLMRGNAISQTPMDPPREEGINSSRNHPRSDFDVRKMPRDRIVTRTLYPWSVHHSTHHWIATISRPIYDSSSITNSNTSNIVNPERVRYIQFPFSTEKEAKKFCKAYAPPKFQTGSSLTCCLCKRQATYRHCRNCGVAVCDACSTRWGAKMIPKTYATVHTRSMTVRVCKSCDWLSNAFCMALLRGRYQDALAIHETGNVNLRTSFADIHREAMFPIHCAVMGGSLELVQWLVDTQLCPVSVARDAKGRRLSVQTSSGRTLLDLAMTGRPKVDVLAFLISKGLCVTDAKDPSLAPKTLETVLKVGLLPSSNSLEMPSQLEMDESVTTIEDACSLCCEKPMDCVLIPCGHQLCCADCGSNLRACPACKVICSVLRIFRQ